MLYPRRSAGGSDRALLSPIYKDIVLVRRVISPPDKLVDDAVAVMVSAMKGGDTALGALCGGDLAIFPLLARAMIREGVIWGEFWTAEENGELVGFMTWTPPGVEPNIPKDERAKVNAEFVEALSEEGKAYSRTAIGEDFHNFVAQCVGEKGKDGGWWLRVAMVRPDKQGQGIARKLFEPMRRKAAERNEHIACTTTTLHNVEIYKALGFEHRGSHTFPCKWGDWSLYALYMKP